MSKSTGALEGLVDKIVSEVMDEGRIVELCSYLEQIVDVYTASEVDYSKIVNHKKVKANKQSYWKWSRKKLIDILSGSPIRQQFRDDMRLEQDEDSLFDLWQCSDCGSEITAGDVYIRFKDSYVDPENVMDMMLLASRVFNLRYEDLTLSCQECRYIFNIMKAEGCSVKEAKIRRRAREFLTESPQSQRFWLQSRGYTLDQMKTRHDRKDLFIEDMMRSMDE